MRLFAAVFGQQSASGRCKRGRTSAPLYSRPRDSQLHAVTMRVLRDMNAAFSHHVK